MQGPSQNPISSKGVNTKQENNARSDAKSYIFIRGQSKIRQMQGPTQNQITPRNNATTETKSDIFKRANAVT